MLLGAREQKVVADRFQNLVGPVRLVMFTQEVECQFCRDTRELVEQLASLSDKIKAEIYNFVLDKEQVAQYGVNKIPAVAIVGAKDYGIRYYGIPSGYEFSALVDDIVDVSKDDSGLSAESRKALAGLTSDVHLQVFTTPTCPYCPQAVRLAHKMAIESDHVRADCVEAMEFPQLVARYQVRGVPRTVVNDSASLDGALPEAAYVAAIVQAVAQAGAPRS